MVEQGILVGTITARGRLSAGIFTQQRLTAAISSKGRLAADITTHGIMVAGITGKGRLDGSISTQGQLIGKIIDGASEECDTYILVCDDGTELPAVFVENEVVFTATENDIRKGTVAATDDGVTVGTKEIPSYHTSVGYKIVTNGSKFVLPLQYYDYIKLQAMMCPYDTSIVNSVAVEKVVIEDSVYPVQSTTAESSITIDIVNKGVDFGITNNTGSTYIIRYFSYKEIY